MSKSASLFFVLLAFNLTAFSNPEPIKLHPQNNRYFEWRGNPMVIVTSVEHYGAVCNSDFDYIAYLNELQSKGLNMARIFSGIYSEYDFWCPNNTLGPAIGKLITPWVRDPNAGDCLIASGAGGGKKFNLNQWNTEYFDRLKDFLTQAANRGIVVEISLFSPYYNSMFLYAPINGSNNINGINFPQSEFFDVGNTNAMNFAYAMVDKFVAELENYDNFWFEVANEPYFPEYEISEAWQVNITNRIVQQESNFTYRHLIARNVCETCPIINAIPNISIYNVHYGHHSQPLNNQNLNKVIALDEDWDFPWFNDYAVRSYGWKWIMAGGGLYNHLDPSFQNGYWSGYGTQLASQWGRTSWGNAAIRSQLGYCKEFVSSLPFISMAPNSSCIVSVSGGGSALALAQTGIAYGVYIYDGSTGNLTMNLPAAGNYTATWISTTTGSVLSSSSFSHSGGNVTFASPAFSGDIALSVVNPDALPIQLASFTGAFVGSSVSLRWRTISEVNNYGFFVQRKQASGAVWTPVNTTIIPGFGTTNEPRDYTYLDTLVSPGNWQYRLRQIDLDGAEHFTEPINVSALTSVNGVAPTEFALHQNYPNPFNPTTNINFSIPNDGMVSLNVFDMLGREVISLVNEVRIAGSYTESFDASRLTSGIYFYRLESGSFSKTMKLTVIK